MIQNVGDLRPDAETEPLQLECLEHRPVHYPYRRSMNDAPAAGPEDAGYRRQLESIHVIPPLDRVRPGIGIGDAVGPVCHTVGAVRLVVKAMPWMSGAGQTGVSFCPVLQRPGDAGLPST